MKKLKQLNNQAGLTLIEVLLTIVIFSIISVVVYGVLLQFNSHYAKINSEVQFRDEADIIMANFTNYIYPSTSVTPIPSSQLLKVRTSENKFVNLGFKDGNAVISNEYTDGETITYSPINSEKFLLYTESADVGSHISVVNNYVQIRLHIQSKNVSHAKPFIVESRITFVR